MCIGIPMRVVEPGAFTAQCEDARGGGRAEIDMRLVGPQAAGTWVLTFLGAAREVVDAAEAALIADALQALDVAMAGGTPPEHLFADLIAREPELPDFLKPAPQKGAA